MLDRVGLLDVTPRRGAFEMENHLHESGVAATDALRRQGFWNDEIG